MGSVTSHCIRYQLVTRTAGGLKISGCEDTWSSTWEFDTASTSAGLNRSLHIFNHPRLYLMTGISHLILLVHGRGVCPLLPECRSTLRRSEQRFEEIKHISGG
ncbi:predicted protein [Histoplasma capsulatum G186AR]|uniref:Uncharacterized protein n=1 Tax=Ajellomyces capsulatus (strain G186AR / H82 / ATCC MYA-2454 / RMSCC 2432) TaxID=447093 RepID=C0NZZ5_AJECG|nr:uncharacterized protein HCBG_08725 [Histoplasma capsulatum G186AR]EEH03085.1 predicted protein [Histoplasma capsulatum G186AR]